MTMHQQESYFRDTIDALRRRWKMITAFGLSAAVVAALVGFVIPPRYTAKTQMVVEIPDTGTPAGWLDEAAVETRVQLLMSIGHLKRVLDTLAADTRNPAAAAIPYETLQRNLNAYKELHSRVIAVTYTDTNPAVAALVANTSAKIYLETLAERWRRERGDIKAVDAQIPVVKDKLQKAEAALQAYRSASRTTGSRVADASGVAPAADRDPNQTEVRLRNMERETAATAELYQTLLKRHKELISQEVPAPEVRIASLATPPDQPSSPNPLLFIPPAAVMAMIMGAFLAIALDRLDTTIRKQADVVDALGIPCVGLVPIFDATSGSRTFSERCHERARSFLASISRWGKRVLSLTAMPTTDGKNEKTRRRRTLDAGIDGRSDEQPMVLSAHHSFERNPFSPYSEAIRSTVMSTLEPKSEKGRPQIVLITSSVQGEGKTTLAVSFATYAALLGRKVLLIDFDFRNPGILGQLAGADETGTLEVLEGAPVTGMIKKHAELGIDYLPLPRRAMDPLPLLQHPDLSGLLKQIAKDYDCVVMDSAPILSTTETGLLSAIAHKVLFAIQWGSTRREIVQHAFRQLQIAKTSAEPRAVAVITRVDLKRHSLYRFGDVGEALARFPFEEPSRA